MFSSFHELHSMSDTLRKHILKNCILAYITTNRELYLVRDVRVSLSFCLLCIWLIKMLTSMIELLPFPCIPMIFTSMLLLPSCVSHFHVLTSIVLQSLVHVLKYRSSMSHRLQLSRSNAGKALSGDPTGISRTPAGDVHGRAKYCFLQ